MTSLSDAEPIQMEIGESFNMNEDYQDYGVDYET